MIQRCALMECELDEADISLCEILKLDSKINSLAIHQAKELIEHHGFKETDILCIECFWK